MKRIFLKKIQVHLTHLNKLFVYTIF